jgi:hypothetical protein
MATWNDVRRIALELPGVCEDATAGGKRAWTLRKKLLVWERPLRKADLAVLGDRAPSGDILGIRTPDLELKEALLASAPDVFFTTPHFDGYSAVLVRLRAIGVRTLRDVLVEAWLSQAPKTAVKKFLASKD